MLSERLDRWLRAHTTLVDSAVAALAAFVLGLAGLTGGPYMAMLSVAMVAPLALRRRFPVAVVCVVGALALLTWYRLPYPLLAHLAVPAAVHTAIAYGPRWFGRVTLVVAVVGAGMATQKWGVFGSTGMITMFVAMVAAIAVAWALAALGRLRRDQLRTLEERAHLLEVERDQHARLAAAAERTRIARELHDVVAHSLAVVVAQADGGRYAARTSPAAADEALTTIGTTAREALTEMRRLLGVLRTEEPDGGARVPQPGLEDLEALAGRLRAGGTMVTLESRGRPRPVPEGLGLAVYRIVQEGLTNVLKHAGPGARADVVMEWSPGHLRVSVLDDGRGPAPDGADRAGHGLAGMRERAALYGGRVDAGPRPGGGFAVRAELPLWPEPAGAAGATA